jgi:hypothetical protein
VSEAMAVETIVEAYWRLQGYWTKLRFPFQKERGGWSDIDILAYHPEKKVLVISESKVRGSKRDIYAYTKYSREEYGTIFDYDKEKKKENYLAFLRHVKYICSNKTVFGNFRDMVNSLIIQLVSNYFIDNDVLQGVKRDIFKRIVDSVPARVKTEIRLDTTLAIICEIIRLEEESPQGRRYGHPVIDMARELNRYFHPNIKYAGREKREVEVIREKFKKMFMDSLKL